VNPLKIPCIFVSVMLCNYSCTVQTPATLKITIVSSPSRLITEGVDSRIIGPLDLQHHHELFAPFKLKEQFNLGFRALPQCWKIIVSLVVRRECCVMRRCHTDRYLQSRDQGSLVSCIYYPPPGLIHGGSNICHRLIPHITLLRARDYALTAFLIKQ
jgi:hypothetical protein